jgi:hypothetical protein
VSSPFFKQRLSPQDRSALLREILSSARAGGSFRPSLIFDLDGTLMDNRPRVVAILHELGEAWRSEHPDAAAACARAQNDDIVYGFVENLKRLGIEDGRLHEEGFAFWRERFFHDPHVKHDVEVPGAAEFVRACHGAGANIVYLTGRDLPNMALGSFASLRDLGFPIGVIGTQLVTKPNFEMPDTDFKRDVLPELPRAGPVLAAFDNESANCNLFVEAYPTCTTVFVDTQHAPNPPPLDPRVKVIDSFELPE